MTENVRKSGSGDKLMDWLVIVAAIILFAKTSDVLSYFAPQILSDILGFDTSFIYGVVTAILVEGLALILHFNRRARLSPSAQTVKWIALAISGACQIYDGFITTDSISQMSDTMKGVLSYGVPLIPLIIVVMIFGIGHLPEVDEAPVPFKGLKNIVVPTVRRLWNGDPSLPAPLASEKDNVSETETVRQLDNHMDVRQTTFSDNGNGKRSEEKNFS